MRISNFQAKVLIEELIRHQIDYFCLSPGSRLTPFSHAIAYHEKARDFIHFDERGLAFHALGYAKACKKPAPIFITSGSSLANLFPAVVEAYQSQIPLLIFSADRPYELRDCKANQSLDQVNFFHKYVHWHQDLPLFDSTCTLDFLGSTVAQALAFAQKGPVHLNCQFREPFFTEVELDAELYTHWLQKKSAQTVFYPSTTQLIAPPQLNPNKHGIILCGRETNEEDYKAIEQLAKKLQWPLFTDVLSFGHFGSKASTIKHYDLIFKNKLNPPVESVLQFNNAYLSKALLLYLKQAPLDSYHCISPSSQRLEPHHLSADVFETSARDYCEQVQLTQKPFDSSWLKTWQELDKSTSSVVNRFSSTIDILTEPFSICDILRDSEPHDLFYIASSMAIRDTLSYAQCAHPLHLFCNRGASGIDGNLATAFGLSQALDKPVQIIIGDTAFLYDLNSLAQIQELKHPPVLYVLNNSGGGIFSFLPIAQDKQIIQRYFQAKHSYTFEKIAEQFHFHYTRPKSRSELQKLLKTKAPLLVEVQTQVEENVDLHHKLDQQIQCLYTFKNGEIPISLS